MLEHGVVFVIFHAVVGGAGQVVSASVQASAARSRGVKTAGVSRQTATRSSLAGATRSLRARFRWNCTQNAHPLICDARSLTSSVSGFSSPEASTALPSACNAGATPTAVSTNSE